MAFRVQPPPTGTLYSVLQKAKPGWSTKDLVKVYQKLQKVSITDGESLARAVSEGSLNHILAEAGERKLKPSTLQLLRLASRDPGARKVQVAEEDLPLLGPRHCFCGNCIRVPMCHQHADVLTMKLPSIKSLGPPPLMPSRREKASRWQPRQRQVAVAPLPRVKSEPLISKAEARSRLFGDWNVAGRKLNSPVAPAPIPLEAWPKKVLSPILATVPERSRRCVVLPQRLGGLALRREAAKEDVLVPSVEAQQSLLKSASTSSFHSYATFVEKQGQDAQDAQEGEEEEIQHLEVAYSSQESYAMTFEGSSQPSRSNESGLDARWSRTQSDQEIPFDEEDLEDGSVSLNESDEDMADLADVTADVSGLLRSRPLNSTMEALKELSELDETLPVSRSPKPRKASAPDHRQQVAAARRQQQRRRMIRAYG